jgi:hypothetical protein
MTKSLDPILAGGFRAVPSPATTDGLSPFSSTVTARQFAHRFGSARPEPSPSNDENSAENAIRIRGATASLLESASCPVHFRAFIPLDDDLSAVVVEIVQLVKMDVKALWRFAFCYSKQCLREQAQTLPIAGQPQLTACPSLEMQSRYIIDLDDWQSVSSEGHSNCLHVLHGQPDSLS